jgi:5-methyltetrahydropteroyltriglutamate--homocysteine methyltransferase
MSPRDRPPFRADHVGSLLRPAALPRARDEHAAGRIDDVGLRSATDVTPAAMKIDDRLDVSERIFGNAFAFLRETVGDGGPVPRLTIPSPSIVHDRGGHAAIDETLYPDLDRFWCDLTAACASSGRT